MFRHKQLVALLEELIILARLADVNFEKALVEAINRSES